MTSVLAFDTSGPWCSVCISQNQQIIAHASQHLPRGHSRELLPMINTTLGTAKLSYSQIDRIATITGPGSFTGLRVGLSTAQGISFALKKPLIGINAFQAYATSVDTKDNILVTIDTQKEDVYCQLLDYKGTPLKDAKALNPSEIADYAGAEPYCIAGDKSTQGLNGSFTRHETTPDQLCQNIALLAELRLSNNYGAAEPFYINPPKITKKDKSSIT